MYNILNRNGRMLRFEVDDYIELNPNPGLDFTFLECCPLTGRENGISVDEFRETICLPFVSKNFIGVSGLNEFKEFMYYKLRNLDNNKATSAQLKNLDCRLMGISKKVISQSQQILKRIEIFAIGDSKGYSFEFEIQLYINKEHRLYHPKSDNILCAYTGEVGLNAKESKILLRYDTWELEGEVNLGFNHCFLLHDFVNHKGVKVKELLDFEFAVIDYRPGLEQKIEF